MADSKTTVVIPNFNGMKYLPECLASLEEQTVAHKVIVVDNGSTDESVEWTKAHYPKVALHCFAENTGFCKAVNAGIYQADTPYVFLLNNDTTVEANAIEELEAMMQRYPASFSIAAKMVAMKNPELLDGAGDLYCALGWAYARGKGRKVQTCEENALIFAACAGAALYQRKLFDEIGYFDEAHFAYLEDLDIGYRAQIYGYQNRYAAKAVVRHAGSSVSGSRYNEFKTSLASRNSVYVIFKNMPFWQIILNSPFLVMGFVIKTLFFTKKGFGKTYVKGLWQGVKLSRSQVGRERKIKFQLKYFPNYARIQGNLWINTIKRVFGGI